MGEIAFENSGISDFQGLVTLTLDRSCCIPSCITQTSTYIPNFIEIKESFCGRMDGRTDIYLRPTLLGRLGGVDLKRDDRLIRAQFIDTV